jgi:hypothetical protein
MGGSSSAKHAMFPVPQMVDLKIKLVIWAYTHVSTERTDVPRIVSLQLLHSPLLHPSYLDILFTRMLWWQCSGLAVVCQRKPEGKTAAGRETETLSVFTHTTHATSFCTFSRWYWKKSQRPLCYILLKNLLTEHYYLSVLLSPIFLSSYVTGNDNYSI